MKKMGANATKRVAGRRSDLPTSWLSSVRNAHTIEPSKLKIIGNNNGAEREPQSFLTMLILMNEGFAHSTTIIQSSVI